MFIHHPLILLFCVSSMGLFTFTNYAFNSASSTLGSLNNIRRIKMEIGSSFSVISVISVISKITRMMARE